MAEPERPRRPEELWDRFVDALDLAGQAGGAERVIVPAFGDGSLAGREFGDLTKDDAQALARIANGLARRGETILALWKDMQQRRRTTGKRRR